MPSVLGPTEICNLALGKLGPASGFLTALDTDTSVAGQACRRTYAAMRDEVMEGYPWRFARRRAALAASVTTPAWGFTQQFVLPSDFLRIISVELDGAKYEIEGEFLLCDEDAPLNIRYLAKIEDTSKFSPTFVSALACRIGAEICETVTKSTTKKQGLLQEYTALLRQAKTVEGMGVASVQPRDGSFIDARR